MDVALPIAPLSAPPKGLPFEPRAYSEHEITAGGFQSGVLFHARRGETDQMIRRLKDKVGRWAAPLPLSFLLLQCNEIFSPHRAPNPPQNEDLEQLDEGDMTALMWAAFHQSAEMIEVRQRAR